jgi:hypothetical protein
MVQLVIQPGCLLSRNSHVDLVLDSTWGSKYYLNSYLLDYQLQKQNMNAPDLIEAALLQSLWISNFKKSLVDMTISKVLARWFKNKLIHSTKETRTNSSYHPALANGHDMYYQELCTTEMKERTKFLMGTLFALQVRLGMRMPITHVT